MDQIKSVCFTGHRHIGFNETLQKRLYTAIEERIVGGAEDFYAGAALGWDMFCEKAVLAMKSRYPLIKLHLILPCPPEEQTARWNASSVSEYSRLLRAADDHTVVSTRYTPYCMKLRNERLIELSDCCICYYTDAKSGTGQTVRLAQKKGIRIINLALPE